MRKTIIALLLTAIIGGKAHAADSDKYFGIAPGYNVRKGNGDNGRHGMGDTKP